MLRKRHVAAAQSAIWITAGLWPVFHLRSFARVTGSKPEGWLVKTVGLLLASIGAGLATSVARRERLPDALALTAGLAAGGLTAIDVFYAGYQRRISPIYLLDGVLHCGFIAAWLLGAPDDEPQPRRR